MRLDYYRGPLPCPIDAGTSDASAPRLSWVEGDAEKLPIASNSVDLFTIAFGIRNVTHVDQAVREAFRVLKPGGRFMCLEFSRVENPLMRQVYDAVRMWRGPGAVDSRKSSPSRIRKDDGHHRSLPSVPAPRLHHCSTHSTSSPPWAAQ